MVTFLDLYESLVKYVNFKLYHDAGLSYPPVQAREMSDATGGLSLAVFDVNPLVVSADKEHEKDDVANASGDDDEVILEEGEGETKKQVVQLNKAMEDKLKAFTTLFANDVVFISREVQRTPFDFILRSLGCTKVGWEVPLGDDSADLTKVIKCSDPSVTIQLVDRPNIVAEFAGRIYVQPQYIFDCLNAGTKLPIERYLPGAKLPAHVSPFVDDDKEGYGMLLFQCHLLDMFQKKRRF